jgi:hypothetical protein
MQVAIEAAEGNLFAGSETRRRAVAGDASSAAPEHDHEDGDEAARVLSRRSPRAIPNRATLAAAATSAADPSRASAPVSWADMVSPG